ncbi:MAG: YceI family protein [Verrucomicrobia bacterium]|nr:YceI family protein [Verrucomicrobiota bacterium]
MNLLTASQLRDYAARHIAGSVNACSYETAFQIKVQELSPDSARAIVVYGEGSPSLDSADAAEKLINAGYSNVSDFRGGLREWESAGLPVESHAPLPAAPIIDGTFKIDTIASVIRWTGQNLFNHHDGTLQIADGILQITQGALRSGEFTIDMNSIACSDLKDSTWNAMLIEHLRTADFFQVQEHPTARFVISSATPIPNASDGVPNHQVAGNLTLRGVTKALTFPAVIAAADADHITAPADYSPF